MSWERRLFRSSEDSLAHKHVQPFSNTLMISRHRLLNKKDGCLYVEQKQDKAYKNQSKTFCVSVLVKVI